MTEDNNPQSRLLVAIATINDALKDLTNREVKDALTMISSIRNLRVVSMDRPIGLSTNQSPMAKPSASGDRKPAGGRKPTPKATWKSDPRWVEIDNSHSQLITEIKNSSDPLRKSELIENLRDTETQMKTLKHQLQGFRQTG